MLNRRAMRARVMDTLDCVHTVPARFENSEKCDAQASRSRENSKIFCRHISKMVDFENGILTVKF